MIQAWEKEKDMVDKKAVGNMHDFMVIPELLVLFPHDYEYQQ